MSTTAHAERRPDILLVEDSLIDVRLTTEALESGRVPHRLHVVCNGEEALAFLRREERYANAPRPTLILLDLNLPRTDGREVLAEIKASRELQVIPVCVLTASTDEKDILEAYRLGANCCVMKSIDAAQFIRRVQRAADFWLTIAQLPAAGENARA